MSWIIQYLPEAVEDFRGLDRSQQILIRKAIAKLARNPLPETEGGYGKWLGSRDKTKLAGFLKVKLRVAGLRIVYKLIRQEGQVLLVVIGVREDSEVYEEAHKRVHRHKL